MKKLTLATLGLGAGVLGLSGGSSAIAQENAATSLDEIFVTGRKREESLVDVPVSISVFSSGDLEDQGISELQELFDATPGLVYDETFGDRNSSQPGIRGVQSNESVSTQQKVNFFVDGLPTTGQTAGIGFFGVEQVEIYRGPQSAVFGRSTFAGAINYVTADAAEDFEGSLSLGTSTLEGNNIGLTASGPLTDSIGYRIGYSENSFTGPDEWTANDGVQTGNQESSTFVAKLNFEVSPTAYGELMFSKSEQDDGATAAYFLDPADCQGDSGIWLNSMGDRSELFSGDWDCDMDSDIVRRNHDLLTDFIADYDPTAFGGMDIDTYLAQTDSAGVTYEQQLLIASVVPSVEVERDRWQGEMNFEVGDSLLSFLGMYSTEYDNRWQPPKSDSRAIFTSRDSLNGNQGGRTVRGSPVDIEEKYLEARWVSPDSERLRYTLSGSYYAYDYRLESYDDWGAIYYDLTDSTGEPLDPGLNNLISKITDNRGISAGVQYDLTDRTTLSFEGRYQTDEVCGVDIDGTYESCKNTTSFAPRLAINTTISDQLSVYAQFSQGTNPAGVNIGFADEDVILAVSIANGSIPVPDLAPDGVSVPGNAGVTYSDGSATAPATAGYDADAFVAYTEETLTNFEIGAKGSFHDGRGSFSSALYYMIWEDLLSVRTIDWDDDSSIADGDAYDGWNYEEYWENSWRSTLNAGDATLYGLEMAASYNISDIWSIGGNLTLSSSTYDDYCSLGATNYYDAASGGNRIFADEILTPAADGVIATCSPVDGNDLPKSSTVKGAFDISAHLPQDIFGMQASVRADVRHTGQTFLDDYNLNSMGAVTTMNLSANLRNDNLSVRIFVNNLTDNDQPLSVQANGRDDDGATYNTVVSSSAWLVTPRRPREVGVSVSYDF